MNTETDTTKTVCIKDATGAALNWLVAQALGYTDVQISAFDDADTQEHCFFRPAKIVHGVELCGSGVAWHPATNLAQGARLTEQEKIGSEFLPSQDVWWATHPANAGGLIRYHGSGPTQMIAAMRCLVSRYLGDTFNVPAQLV